MSLAETVVLGALAGFTIYLGLPFGRLEVLSKRARVALAMFSVGVLAFLFVDVLEHAFGIVEGHVEGLNEGEGSALTAIGMAGLLGLGFSAGTAGLAMLEKRIRPKRPMPPMAGGATDALTVEQAAALAEGTDTARSNALRVGMTIAAAI